MSYFFWKSVLRGMCLGAIILCVGLVVLVLFTLPDPTMMDKIHIRLLSVVLSSTVAGAMYVHTLYKRAYRWARLRNLDRVHPLGNRRTRVGRT